MLPQVLVGFCAEAGAEGGGLREAGVNVECFLDGGEFVETTCFCDGCCEGVGDFYPLFCAVVDCGWLSGSC